MKLIDKIITSYMIEGLGEENKIFFANLLVQIKKERNDKIETMGVGINNAQIYLYYNENWIVETIKKEGVKKMKGVIEHELLHLVFNHCSRGKFYKHNSYIYNIACDIAINPLIGQKHLPKDCLFPERFKLPSKRNAEYYYKELIKQSKSFKCSLLDNHSQWGKSGDKTNSEVVKSAVKSAYEQTQKMQGKLSQELTEGIEELLKPPTINWKTLLKQYIAYTIKNGYKRSWKRPNRRLSCRTDVKGKTSKRNVNILLAIDTSGSISNKDFEDFIAEMRGIIDSQKIDMDMIQCDSEIVDIGNIKKRGKLSIKFKGRGGTSYAPVFKYFNKNFKYDVLIYFTDFYCDFNNCQSAKPIIWVLSKNGDKNVNPPIGKVVEINE